MSDFLLRVFGIDLNYNLGEYEASQFASDPDLESQPLVPAVHVGLVAAASDSDEPPDEPQLIRLSNLRPRQKAKKRWRMPRRTKLAHISDRERALYLWANITNIDQFLGDVYWYYKEKGMTNILLLRLVDLVIMLFLVALAVTLQWGVDYTQLRLASTARLLDVIRDDWQLPFSAKFVVACFVAYLGLRSIQLYVDYFKLRELRNFYRMLSIGDDELLTISWPAVVEKLALLERYNQYILEVPLLPHDIATRIMRVDNYMIALINRDVLDIAPYQLTKTLEWNLKLCIGNFMFKQTADGNKIDERVLKEYNRNALAEQLRRRFRMAALINLVLCPFVAAYFVLLYFFRYFNEYKSNPSLIIGLRQYTPYAEWVLREYNELPHFFARRIHQSIAPASRYINQFPQGFLVINGMSLINFIAGALTAVLVILGLLYDSEDFSFWLLEITAGRSALFYISVLGTVWAVTTLLVNNDSEETVYDPEAALQYVAQFTHYLPARWKGRLHTVEVKREFCTLYSLRVVVICQELLLIVLAPFVLWFRILQNLGAIIDFFRDYSIHVDHLGYICYYAMFNFDKQKKNMQPRAPEAGDDKMIKLYMHFLQLYVPEDTPVPLAATTKRKPADSVELIGLYNVRYQFDEESVHPGHSGVLGMINQFYNQR